MDNKQKRKIMEEEIWLNYYNNYLLEHKTITEKEHLRMCNAIAIHCDQKRKRAEKERER